ncbi:MAG: hypothetical protein K1W38_27520 [Lachnospiraceae bacterium]
MNKKTKIIIASICIVALLAVGAAVTMFVMLMNKEGDTPKDNGVYTMDEGNYQQIMDDMTQQVQEGYFETYMTTDWVFPDGSSEATDTMLGNSPNNTKPIRCELLLDETGEKLFETNVIPVGALVGNCRRRYNSCIFKAGGKRFYRYCKACNVAGGSGSSSGELDHKQA